MLTAFILAVLGVLPAVLAIAALRRQRARLRLADLLVRERLDVYELAYLAGGADHVGTAALTAMSMDRRVRVTPDGTVEVVLPEAGHPMEEAVLEALGWSVPRAVTRAMRVAVPRRLRQVYAEVTRSRQLQSLEQRLTSRRLCVTDAEAQRGARSLARTLAVVCFCAAVLVAVACATPLLPWPVATALAPAAAGLAALVLGRFAPGALATGASSAEGIHADAERLCNDRVVGRPGEEALRAVAVHGATMVPDAELRELLSAVPSTRHHGATQAAEPDAGSTETNPTPATGPETATEAAVASGAGSRMQARTQQTTAGGRRAAKGRWRG